MHNGAAEPASRFSGRRKIVQAERKAREFSGIRLVVQIEAHHVLADLGPWRGSGAIEPTPLRKSNDRTPPIEIFTTVGSRSKSVPCLDAVHWLWREVGDHLGEYLLFRLVAVRLAGEDMSCAGRNQGSSHSARILGTNVLSTLVTGIGGIRAPANTTNSVHPSANGFRHIENSPLT